MYWYGTWEVCRLNWPLYRVAPNFYRSLILRFGKFLNSAGTNFCDWERLVFSLAINFSGSRQNRKKKPIFYVLFVCLLLFFFRVHAFKIQLNQNAVLKNVTQCQWDKLFCGWWEQLQNLEKFKTCTVFPSLPSAPPRQDLGTVSHFLVYYMKHYYSVYKTWLWPRVRYSWDLTLYVLCFPCGLKLFSPVFIPVYRYTRIEPCYACVAANLESFLWVHRVLKCRFIN